jgi:hypothetical protein
MATKTANIHYVAKLDDKVVGSRTSPRVYTHAVVIQWSEAKYRAAAYDYVATSTDKSNFAYYTKQAAHTVETYLTEWKYSSTSEAERAINTAKENIEGGFDAYVERLRQRAIESFEKSVKAGGFAPGVATWCGRADLAHKEAAKYRKQDRIADVWIVLVETTDKPVKTKQHHVYGPSYGVN